MRTFVTRHRSSFVLCGVFILAGVIAASVNGCGGDPVDADLDVFGPRDLTLTDATVPAAGPGPRMTPRRSPRRGGTGYEVIQVTDGGTIRGVCRLSGPLRLPNVPVNKDQTGCKHTTHPSERAVYTEGTLTLANCVVYLRDIDRGHAFPKPEGGRHRALLDQSGCRYVPHVQAVPAKSQLAFKNSDTAEHNIHGFFNSERNSLFNMLQSAGGFNDKSSNGYLKKAGLYIFKCDIHPWMAGYVHAFAHPYYAVTGKDGAYELKDVPAGTYEIVCWHEGLQEEPQIQGGEITGYWYGPAWEPAETMEVEVAAGGVAVQDFVVPVPTGTK